MLPWLASPSLAWRGLGESRQNHSAGIFLMLVPWFGLELLGEASVFPGL